MDVFRHIQGKCYIWSIILAYGLASSVAQWMREMVRPTHGCPVQQDWEWRLVRCPSPWWSGRLVPIHVDTKLNSFYFRIFLVLALLALTGGRTGGIYSTDDEELSSVSLSSSQSTVSGQGWCVAIVVGGNATGCAVWPTFGTYTLVGNSSSLLKLKSLQCGAAFVALFLSMSAR